LAATNHEVNETGDKLTPPAGAYQDPLLTFKQSPWNNGKLIFGVSVLGVLVILTLVGRAFWNGDLIYVGSSPLNLPPIGFEYRNQAGSWSYPLGTDNSGRDMLALILTGLPRSLGIGFVAALIGLGVGIFLGFSAGYHHEYSRSSGIDHYSIADTGCRIFLDGDTPCLIRLAKTNPNTQGAGAIYETFGLCKTGATFGLVLPGHYVCRNNAQSVSLSGIPIDRRNIFLGSRIGRPRSIGVGFAEYSFPGYYPQQRHKFLRDDSRNVVVVGNANHNPGAHFFVPLAHYRRDGRGDQPAVAECVGENQINL
jgi:hypothetical protein